MRLVQSVYEGLVLTMYNVTCTTLPVLIFGLVEQNLPASLLMSRPHLYQRVAHNAILSWPRFFKWTFFGMQGGEEDVGRGGKKKVMSQLST